MTVQCDVCGKHFRDDDRLETHQQKRHQTGLGRWSQ